MPPSKQRRRRRTATFTAAAFLAAAAGVGTVTPAAALTTETPLRAVSCPAADSWSTVKNSIDWLKVHTAPRASAPSVGQIPGGSRFHYHHNAVSHGFVCGYGYNGSTKVTGWVAASYLNWP
ncbi:hypothetical protein [Streptomyces chrestomyceticus]|uniref:hypothetical protein n=1 Tax=Streptomyces chrestomyceticus TaxID=68185 RepID=UPI0019D1576E|nr:hypothetical protein [Streptomyces chrestomyceticus]